MNSTNQRLTRPPIVEAMLDIRVNPTPSVLHESLLKCQTRIRGTYPNARRIGQVTSTIMSDGTVSTAPSPASVGYRFGSKDSLRTFQARLTNFTFGQLSPYPGWDSFFAEARSLWEQYERIVRPLEITRIGLRFINRIDVPKPRLEMKEYFRTFLEIPDELPQTMLAFSFRYTLDMGNDVRATVTQAPVEAEAEGVTSIVLDIDTAKSEALPQDDSIWTVFAKLRASKNAIFESCITPLTREMYL